MKYSCPICGWPDLQEPARDEEGAPSYEICLSCGFEFGFDDDAQGLTYETARARWIEGGMKWWSHSRPAPSDWDPVGQLERAGLD